MIINISNLSSNIGILTSQSFVSNCRCRGVLVVIWNLKNSVGKEVFHFCKELLKNDSDYMAS